MKRRVIYEQSRQIKQKHRPEQWPMTNHHCTANGQCLQYEDNAREFRSFILLLRADEREKSDT